MNTTKKIFFILAAMLMLVGCKEDNWMDWKAQNEMWMEQNALSDPAIQTTESGLQYKIITMGNTTDVRPQEGSVVYCDYKGHLINGYQFDAATNTSLTLQSGSVIDGFLEGMKKIYTHGDIMLYVPWDLGYGKDGYGTEGNSSFIPPYSTLIFEIHLSAVAN